MAKGSFLYQNLTPAAAISGSANAAGLGWDQLQDVQPRHRARVAATSAFFILDLGAGNSIDVAALISTSLDGASTARLRMSLTDATALSALVYDSTVQAACTDPAWNGAVIGCLSAPVTARYIRWDLAAAGAPIDIGLAPCGLLWRPGRNFGYGGQEGRSDPSTRDVNPDTGAEFGFALPQKRTKLVTYSGLTKVETRTSLDAMDRLVGVSGDALFVEDSDASWADRARDAIWGAFKPAGGDTLASRTAANVFSRSFKITERL
jgi:hypothetical protein